MYLIIGLGVCKYESFRNYFLHLFETSLEPIMFCRVPKAYYKSKPNYVEYQRFPRGTNRTLRRFAFLFGIKIAGKHARGFGF